MPGAIKKTVSLVYTFGSDMKMPVFIFTCIIFTTLLAGCGKTNTPIEIIPVPNGDFEGWTSQLPNYWRTNSCPFCVPPFDTYVVKKDTTSYQGKFAARIIFNTVFRTYAINTFACTQHPNALSAFVKADIIPGDTASISIVLLKNSVPVDSGSLQFTSPINNFSQIAIPISNNSPNIDSISIKILGGKKFGAQTSTFWVDDIYLER